MYVLFLKDNFEIRCELRRGRQYTKAYKTSIKTSRSFEDFGRDVLQYITSETSFKGSPYVKSSVLSSFHVFINTKHESQMMGICQDNDYTGGYILQGLTGLASLMTRSRILGSKGGFINDFSVVLTTLLPLNLISL